MISIFRKIIIQKLDELLKILKPANVLTSILSTSKILLYLLYLKNNIFIFFPELKKKGFRFVHEAVHLIPLNYPCMIHYCRVDDALRVHAVLIVDLRPRSPAANFRCHRAAKNLSRADTVGNFSAARKEPEGEHIRFDFSLDRSSVVIAFRYSMHVHKQYSF